MFTATIHTGERHLRKVSDAFGHLRFFYSLESAVVVFLFASVVKGEFQSTVGKFLDLTALSLSIGFWNCYRIFQKESFLNRRLLQTTVLPLVFFVGFCLISVLWSPLGYEGHYASVKGGKLFITTIFCLSSGIIIGSRPEYINKFMKALVVWGVIYISAYAVVLPNSNLQNPVTLLNADYLSIGRFVGMVVLAAFCMLCGKEKNRKKLLLLALASFGLFLLIIIGGRGPLIATIAALGVIAIHSFLGSAGRSIKLIRNSPVVSFLLLISVLYISFLAFLTTSETLRDTLSDFATFKRLLILFGNESYGSSAETRMGFISSAFNVWATSPFIGTGLASWPYLHFHLDIRMYPHNIVAELLAETGLIGVILFFAPMLFMIRQISIHFKRYIEDNHSVLLMAIFLYTFINAQITSDINGNKIFIFAYIALATYTCIDPRHPKKPTLPNVTPLNK